MLHETDVVCTNCTQPTGLTKSKPLGHRIEGNTVGETLATNDEGDVLGQLEGDCDGVLLGTTLGFKEGTNEGDTLGKVTGVALGADDGSKVGLLLGRTLGPLLGDDDGIELGT